MLAPHHSQTTGRDFSYAYFALPFVLSHADKAVRLLLRFRFTLYGGQLTNALRLQRLRRLPVKSALGVDIGSRLVLNNS